MRTFRIYIEFGGGEQLLRVRAARREVRGRWWAFVDEAGGLVAEVPEEIVTAWDERGGEEALTKEEEL